MKIKKLDPKDYFDAYLISAYCFHMRVEDPEAKRKEIEEEKHEDWGAFDEDGTMMARIINNRFSFYLDGQAVTAGGIGAVSTLPEYRDFGAIRAIFKEQLPSAYKNGEVISALYPFKHAFYRKAGYEVVTFMNEYAFAPSVLSDYRFNGEVRKWNPGDSVADFMQVYQAFAPKFNFAMERNEDQMLEHMKVEKPYLDRKFSYVFKQDGKPIAYLIFTDVRHDPAAILQVEECAWTRREGFLALLGFLARFEADYGEIKLPLPKGIDLLRILHSPRAYDVQKETQQNFMVRVIHAKKLLEVIRKPSDCDFTVKVTDDLIRENNGMFRVKADLVQRIPESRTKKTADLEVDVRALGQMAVGAVNFDEALLRGDVSVHAKEDMLRNVFTEKSIFCGEHF